MAIIVSGKDGTQIIGQIVHSKNAPRRVGKVVQAEQGGQLVTVKWLSGKMSKVRLRSLRDMGALVTEMEEKAQRCRDAYERAVRLDMNEREPRPCVSEQATQPVPPPPPQAAVPHQATHTMRPE